MLEKILNAIRSIFLNPVRKTLDITAVKGARTNIKDIKVYGDGDTFGLLCKASSNDEGWMKSTKVCNVSGGCIVQVSTQQRNPDGSYALAEALTFVPGNHINRDVEPRVLDPIPYDELNIPSIDLQAYEGHLCCCDHSE